MLNLTSTKKEVAFLFDGNIEAFKKEVAEEGYRIDVAEIFSTEENIIIVAEQSYYYPAVVGEDGILSEGEERNTYFDAESVKKGEYLIFSENVNHVVSTHSRDEESLLRKYLISETLNEKTPEA